MWLYLPLAVDGLLNNRRRLLTEKTYDGHFILDWPEQLLLSHTETPSCLPVAPAREKRFGLSYTSSVEVESRDEVPFKPLLRAVREDCSGVKHSLRHQRMVAAVYRLCISFIGEL